MTWQAQEAELRCTAAPLLLSGAKGAHAFFFYHADELL